MTVPDAHTPSLDLGLIGNCGTSALIDRRGAVVWSCLPDFDGDPVFHHLLDGDRDVGFYDTLPVDGIAHCEQEYIPNSAILRTRLYDSRGDGFQITDFMPRFSQFGRRFRPMVMIRQIEPVAGQPRIRIRLRPSFDHGATAPPISHGSNHIRYGASPLSLRLTTNAPLPYILEERAFLLCEPLTLHLGPDETLNGAPDTIGRAYFERTLEYWRVWVRSLAIPFEWQESVIRSAITLKLCSFEATGAIVAAMTSSIPEAPMSGRNWDYRYCWLRDAFFVIEALNRVCAHQTMEDFLVYLDNIVAAAPEGRLQPVYGITLETRLDERTVDAMPGYRGMGPVRVGNAAYAQSQNDVYGAVIAAATQAFFDQRLLRSVGVEAFRRLEPLGEAAFSLYATPDAGMWELRGRANVHTSSSVMCWAACDRLARIATHLRLGDRAAHWRERADRVHAVISERAWNAKRGSFVATFDGDTLDANLLLLEQLGFLDGDDPRFAATVAAVERELKRGPYIFRYVTADDFGTPRTAFTVCTFWYINALAVLGRHAEACELLCTMLERRNHLGLLSEDIDPDTHALWGNFPQTYSHVGIINCAMRLSRDWEDIR